ncbi:Hypothetical protein NCS54_00476700 [Fusarium falciforme]|uniref:EthD domain-containing protein n=1 Tax=Fusarium falciforme TaxID=195108 RepID=A0A9W8R6I4_9HYPO|nr:Hypothetical protein NCS54_00476700 [Fusarium falciforme]KAJ4188476.1 hypothetical protein NW755_006638 [Fusarium falciforme]KAJ4239318.1 hypothetical protein NW757_012910 [Fusarium falciforme]WAO87458.1 Hypothetical protein NCS54_00476700 [Fusarium falciforme]
MATVILQYPVGHDFDLEYYVKTHLPIADRIWGPEGLRSWEVIKLGGEGPYQLYTVLKWESAAAFQKAAASEGAKEVQDDVKNFTTAAPVLVFGEAVAAS